ncbi:hypothetical protein QFZ91_006354 [Paraburkholderia sp. JPY419]
MLGPALLEAHFGGAWINLIVRDLASERMTMLLAIHEMGFARGFIKGWFSVRRLGYDLLAARSAALMLISMSRSLAPSSTKLLRPSPKTSPFM